MISIPSEHELQRISTSLQGGSKQQRKRALDEIHRIISNEESGCTDGLLQVWEIMNRPLARLLSDQTEACRDQTVEIFKKFLEVLPVSDKNIIYIIPIISRRLSPQEYIEQSEEVRLKCITLLKIIIQKYKEYLPAYVDDLIGILAKSVADNYPNVKRESCDCVSLLAKTVPKHFYAKSENLIKPTLSNFTHQHYRVRATSVKTIGDILQYGNSKSMEDVATPLAERLFDQSGVVRAAVVEVAGGWLVNLADRYSWWHKILPLVLTGLHDEIESIRILATRMWDAAGVLYMQENMNDERLKDKMDFLSETLDHYPPRLSRPNLGCRTIAQQNLCKLVGGIGLELGDWKPDIRVRSAQLLCVLTLNVEQDVTQHIEKLLPPMYRACNDEDMRVVENVEIAAEYLGYFVDPNIYCHLVIPTLEESPTAGHLRVFAAIIRGSHPNALLPQIKTIASFLRQPHICQSKKCGYQRQILSCCNSLLLRCGKNCQEISQDLFTMIFTTLSITTENSIQAEANRLLSVLTEIESLTNIEALYLLHLRSLLDSIQDNCDTWTIYSAEAQIFWGCFIYANTALSSNMDLVFPTLKETMGENADPELRLKHFILLSEYFLHGRKSLAQISDVHEFVDGILKNSILPGLIWSAGRTAEAIRTAAVCCLCALLENDANIFVNESIENKDGDTQCKPRLFPNAENVSLIFEKIVPVLVSLADDCAKKTRLYSVRAICMIMTIGRQLSCITEEHIHQTYPIMLKKLDDGCDEVRCAAIEALAEVWEAIPESYDKRFSRSHIDVLYTTTIIHLDDPESSFQDLVLGAMMCLAKVHPELLAEKLQNCRMNFRNQKGIDKLLEHCHNLLSN